MARDDDYVEVDAVVRMPKDKRLADSKKTEGWSRGFTPKSTDKGPEHVEIRLKDPGKADSETPADPSPDPQFIFVPQYIEEPHSTREQDEAEELVQLLLGLALLKAAEWAQPRLKRLWVERVAPFLDLKRDQWQRRKALRKAAGEVPGDATTELVAAVPVVGAETGEEPDGVSDALAAYEANMTSHEARAHFVELLIAQHFVNEKMRLLANARIDDSAIPPELASVVQALTAKQVEKALESILTSRPSLVDDLGKLIESAREPATLQLGTSRMTEALLLTEDDR